MQRVFAEPDSPWLVPRYAPPHRDRRLLPAFGDRVIFTRFVAPDKPEGSWQPYYQQWSFALQPPQSRIWEAVGGSAATPPARWTPPPSASGRPNWPSASAPAGDGPGRGHTDCCVLSTALAAADAGVHVAVVSDACAGVDKAHRRALEVMKLYAPLIEVLDADRLLAGQG